MDLNFFKKSRNTIIFLVLFTLIGLPIFYYLVKVDIKVPVYNPADINPRLVDYSIRSKNKNHKIANFELINQNGDVITEKNYENKIYVADFFFTSCQTICINMTSNMRILQQHFEDDNEIMFLSHSVTPKYDSVPVLKSYAIRNEAIDNKWNLVTGDKKHIYELARKSYCAVLDEGDGGKQDFIHTENFVLVDKKKRIRGMYDGTKKESIEKIIADIEMLKKEYKK